MPLLQEPGQAPPEQEEQSILAKIMALIKGPPPAELTEKTRESVRGRFPEDVAETILSGERTPEEMSPGQAASLARSTTPQPRQSRAQQLQASLTAAGEAKDAAKIRQIESEAANLMDGASAEDKKRLNQVVILAQRLLRQQ